MANLQYIPREDDSSTTPSTITIGTISALPRTDYLNDEDLFEVSRFVEEGKYASRCVSWETIMAKCQNSAVSRWNEAYTDECEEFFGEGKTAADSSMLTAILAQGDVPSGIDMPVLKDIYALAKAASKINVKAETAVSDANSAMKTKIAYSADSVFVSAFSAFNSSNELESAGEQPASLSGAYEDSGSALHNRFTVAFEPNKLVSTEYKCERAGVLQLYGWLDTRKVADGSHLEAGWCALEGKINGRWEILQLQSVIPNKSLAYAGFCVPVNASEDKPLYVRVRCGFAPGNASGRYPNADNQFSLSNHVANAFVGGIYVSQ